MPRLFGFTSITDRSRAVANLERYLRNQEISEKRLVNSRRQIAATALLNLQQCPAPEATEVQTVVEVPGIEVQTEETHNDIASLHEQIKSLNSECHLGIKSTN